MDKIEKVLINKNRGWRGLAEVKCYTKDGDHYEEIASSIFSFSQAVWDDLMKGIVVIQDDTNYYVLHLGSSDIADLPHGHQRSVLIKRFKADVVQVFTYEKYHWTSAPSEDVFAIQHFIMNRNNHTTSDWNCIGLRVIPEI